MDCMPSRNMVETGPGSPAGEGQTGNIGVGSVYNGVT